MGHSFVPTHFLLFNDSLILERFTGRRDIILILMDVELLDITGFLCLCMLGLRHNMGIENGRYWAQSE